jgi:hypothetical protein
MSVILIAKPKLGTPFNPQFMSDSFEEVEKYALRVARVYVSPQAYLEAMKWDRDIFDIESQGNINFSKCSFPDYLWGAKFIETGLPDRHCVITAEAEYEAPEGFKPVNPDWDVPHVFVETKGRTWEELDKFIQEEVNSLIPEEDISKSIEYIHCENLEFGYYTDGGDTDGPYALKFSDFESFLVWLTRIGYSEEIDKFIRIRENCPTIIKAFRDFGLPFEKAIMHISLLGGFLPKSSALVSFGFKVNEELYKINLISSLSFMSSKSYILTDYSDIIMETDDLCEFMSELGITCKKIEEKIRIVKSNESRLDPFWNLKPGENLF